MKIAHNKKTTPPLKEDVKKWVIEKFGNDFEPNFLEKIINEYELSVTFHTEYSKKKTINYISKNILKFDRIYRKQETSYWTKRGWSEFDANNKRIVRDKNWYINKYGLVLGLEKYQNKNDNISKNCGHTIDKYIKRYGEELGNLKYGEYKKNCARNLEFFIRKYGEKEGRLKFKIFKKHIGKASKESLLIFDPIITWVSEKFNIEIDEIYYGSGNSREFFIVNDGKTYLYDFTIKSLRLIIEYNGVMFHVNENWDDAKKKNWKHPFKKLTYSESIENDKNKINLAEKNGFKVLTIWSDVPIEENIDICKEFIKNEIK